MLSRPKVISIFSLLHSAPATTTTTTTTTLKDYTTTPTTRLLYYYNNSTLPSNKRNREREERSRERLRKRRNTLQVDGPCMVMVVGVTQRETASESVVRCHHHYMCNMLWVHRDGMASLCCPSRCDPAAQPSPAQPTPNFSISSKTQREKGTGTGCCRVVWGKQGETLFQLVRGPAETPAKIRGYLCWWWLLLRWTGIPLVLWMHNKPRE